MKIAWGTVIAALAVLFAVNSFNAGHVGPWEGKTASPDTSRKFANGIYEGYSRAGYTDEPYWGHAVVRIKGGRIAEVKFSIRDSAKHETFAPGYERHFASIPEYVEQCRNDLKGVSEYPSKLLKSGDPDKVDAVSGQTWSYNIFMESVREALKKAYKK